MSLKMILTGTQLKHFKGGLQCLGRLGSELLIEAIPEKLILRTINTAKSAYASVTFYSNFFESYDVFDATVIQAGVQMKQMLSVFRTQRITWLTCELSTTDNRFTAVLSTENGLQKEYRIPCMDSEILQAAVDKEAFPTCVIAGAAELNKLLGSFQSTLEEITIIATPDNSAGTGQAGKAVHIQSFFDPAKGKADKSLYTQLAVDTHEVFFSYQHSSEEASDVTFNLKDFKTMLSLCESMGANVAIRFDQPGQPLVVEPQFRGAHIQDVDYEAELVLATLMESQPHNLGSMQDAAAAPPTALNPRNQPHLRSGQAGSPNVPGDTPWRAPGAGYVTTPHTAIPTPNTHGFANGRMHDATGQRPTRFAGQHQQHQGQQQDEGRQFHAGGDVPMCDDGDPGSRLPAHGNHQQDQDPGHPGDAELGTARQQEHYSQHNGPSQGAALHQHHNPSCQAAARRRAFMDHDDAGPLGPFSQSVTHAATTAGGQGRFATGATALAQASTAQLQPQAVHPDIPDSEDEEEDGPNQHHKPLQQLNATTSAFPEHPASDHPSSNHHMSERTQAGAHPDGQPAGQGAGLFRPMRSRYLVTRAAAQDSDEDEEEALPETPPG